MEHFFISVLAMAAVLGFMILIHEFGHYAAAKYFGVRVEVFSIGFGTRLLGFRKGETDYRIAAIPLGGYVKMSGENPMDERTGDPGEFLSHPRWQRFVIAFAGPAMNIMLAVVLLTVVYMVHYEYPSYLNQPAVIDGVKQESPAAKAGLQAGDRVVKVDGIENPTWEQLQPRVWLSPNQPLTVTIQRGNETFQKTIVPTQVTTSEIGSAGWYPAEPVVILSVEANMPAARAGLKEDDKIITMNGQPVRSIEGMIESLQKTKDQPVDVVVQRGGRTLNFHMRPVLSNAEDTKQQRYRLGFANKGEITVSRLPFAKAFSLSLDQNKKYSVMILELAKKIAQRKMSLRAVSGPIGIAQDAGYAAEQKGWTPLMELTAGISLNLGIFNLLPIPILDGGVILLLLIEGLMRRDISIQIKERIYQAAFVFLLLFAVTVIYNDIVKAVPGLYQRLP
ncbi:MAG TPA: RIP metalloprotease RseP [Terriglobales bacterium]|nr:RIP metalloprotease RseP [Terriglobales bacterium]